MQSRHRVMKGMRQKAISGGAPGRAPLGYFNQRVRNLEGREVRTVAVDPDRGPHIAWGFDACATGEWSMSQIADGVSPAGRVRTRLPNR